MHRHKTQVCLRLSVPVSFQLPERDEMKPVKHTTHSDGKIYYKLRVVYRVIARQLFFNATHLEFACKQFLHYLQF